MMDCNRDDALKAREIAEKKFATRDIIGAKKFALKAQNLCPDLDGIGQLIATINVHLSAEAMINGERDWYSILSVNNLAENETVKKQYRKLALLLHPDKNRSVGAESAFMLVSEAWRVLSDKTRRRIYDQKRKSQVGCNKFSSHMHGSSGFYHFVNTSVTQFMNHKTTSQRSTCSSTKIPSPVPSTKFSTSWTSCNHCKMQCEHYRVYVNDDLCSNCHKPFLASQAVDSTGRPKSSVHQTPQHSRYAHVQERNGLGSCGTGFTKFQHIPNLNSFDSSNFHWGAFSRTAGAASAAASSSAAAEAANMVRHIYEKVKREREEREAAIRSPESFRRKTHTSKRTPDSTSSKLHGHLNGTLPERKRTFSSDEARLEKKRRSMSNTGINSYEKDRATEMNENVNPGLGSSSFDIEMSNGVRNFVMDEGILRIRRGINMEFSHMDVQKTQTQKAITLVCKNLNEWNTTEISQEEKEEKHKEIFRESW